MDGCEKTEPIFRKTGWWEAYQCGCVSPTVRERRQLLGYCGTHGESRSAVFHETQAVIRSSSGGHTKR